MAQACAAAADCCRQQGFLVMACSSLYVQVQCAAEALVQASDLVTWQQP